MIADGWSLVVIKTCKQAAFIQGTFGIIQFELIWQYQSGKI
jgi:hypothetical protein